VGPGNHVLYGVQIPSGRDNFEGEKGGPTVKYKDTLRSSVQKTAAPIEMLFGLRARMDSRNHVLDGNPGVLRDVAIATNFRTQFAITGFLAISWL